MMRKILATILVLLVIVLVVVSCAPKVTDEELGQELAKLSPEEQQQLLQELESKDDTSLAGKAIANKYGSDKYARASAQQMKAILAKLITTACKDSDNGIDYSKNGEGSSTLGPLHFGLDSCATYPNDNTLIEFYCDGGYLKSKNIDCKQETPYGQKGICVYGVCMSSDTQVPIQCEDTDPDDVSSVRGAVTLKRNHNGNLVTEVVFQDFCSYASVLEQAQCDPSLEQGYDFDQVTCPGGCKDGVCLPQQVITIKN